MAFSKEKALALLKRAKEQGRLSHAYMITGPKAANLEDFTASMLTLFSGTQRNGLDDWQGHGVVILRPQSKSRRIAIGEDGDDPGTIRFLERTVHRTVGAEGYKYGVIVEAERMTIQAQNAFLKTLEEPPAKTQLFLLTSQPGQLLETIRSRVIQITLLPPPGARQFTEHEEKLLAVMERLSAKQSGGVSGALALKAEFQSILEEIYDDIKEGLDGQFGKQKEALAKTTDGSWLKRQEDQVSAQIEANYLLHRDALMDLLLAWMGDVARQQVGGENLDLPTYARATAQLADRWSPLEVTRRLRTLRKLESHLHTNVNEALALEVCFMEAFG
jgi:DNA polymerase-3 subunit delta'